MDCFSELETIIAAESAANDDVFILAVGMGLISAIREEREHESSSVRKGVVARTDSSLMTAAIDRLKLQWPARRGQFADQTRTMISKAAGEVIETALKGAMASNRESFPSRAWFNVWTGLISTTLWVPLAALAAFIAFLIANDWSFPAAWAAFANVGD